MKLITKLMLAGSTLLSVSLPALADTPDWRYVEGGYTRYGFDNSNIEPDGLFFLCWEQGWIGNCSMTLQVQGIHNIGDQHGAFSNSRFPTGALFGTNRFTV